LVPDFIVIGHLTRDEHPDGRYTLGGAATFASIAARNLGYRVGIVTAAADDFPEPQLLHDIEIVRVPSPTTTTFRNLYQAGHRTQYVRDIAAPLTPDAVPLAWRRAKIVLLGPLVGEMDHTMLDIFASDTLLAVSPQGWMRRWDEMGRVRAQAWQAAQTILPRVQVLILSEEDLGGYTERLSSYIALAPLVVLTRGEHGSAIYRHRERPLDIPAFPTQIIDPTGAGDTFATAFLIRYHETQDLAQAARFANAAASLAISSVGAENMPTRAQVQARLNADA